MRTKDPAIFDAIESYINDYHDQHGAAPSMQQIATKIGMAKSTIHSYLARMKEDGRVEYTGTRSLLTRENMKSLGGCLKVPIVGAIACGTPILAQENIEQYVTLPEALFGRGNYYFLRARGESMIEAGIDDGDLVLIRQQDAADYGQIVVARLDDEATLKRYFPERGHIRLHPENEAMEDIIVDQCAVQGVAVKVLKNII